MSDTNHHRMTIAVIGGLDRNAPNLRALAEARGHELEHHAGHWSTPHKRTLASIMGRCDVAVIVTGHNNHPAVQFARTEARRRGIPSLVCRRFSTANLAALLDALARRDAFTQIDRTHDGTLASATWLGELHPSRV